MLGNKGCRTKFGISNRQRHFLLIFDVVEQAGQTRRDFAFNKSSNLFKGGGCTVKLLEVLQLQPV